MNKEIIAKAKELCKDQGHLLYLVKFGSHLYGTNTENSDSDYKGIFLPRKEKLLLGKKCNSVYSNTGNDKSKNTSEDVDVNLWSLHYWLELLRKGDTNAIDLLYVHTYEECVIYDVIPSECLSLRKMFFMQEDGFRVVNNKQSFLDYPDKYINIKENRAYIQYVYNQAKKYGLKGSRMNILEKVRAFVGYHITSLERYCIDEYQGDSLRDYKFSTIIPDLLKEFECQYVKMGTTKDGRELLYILDKGFEGTITIEEAYRRLDNAWNEYGERARQAKENEGIDWKAISHALRCIYQVEEIIETGSLKFPLKLASKLLEVKKGIIPWVECEKLISDGLERVGSALEHVKANKEMNKVHEEFILCFYK